MGYSDHITGEQIVAIVKRLLKTDAALDFIFKSSKSELEMLVAAVKDRVKPKSTNDDP